MVLTFKSKFGTNGTLILNTKKCFRLDQKKRIGSIITIISTGKNHRPTQLNIIQITKPNK